MLLQFKSKRFVAFCVGIVLFVVMVYTTKYSPIELAGAISIITGIYIGLQSYRPSTPDEPKG